MPLNRTYAVAKAIETLIEDMIADGGAFRSEFKNQDIYVSPWHNCRENGFAFSILSKRTVFVAECRNSDDITLTPSEHDEWSAVGDETYKKKREFLRFDEHHKAARRVLELLSEVL